MKLDVNALRYLSREDFRVLTAVEMGQKNHEIVPVDLITAIAGLKHGGTYRHLRTLLRFKLVHHDAKQYDGYRLTYMGYDFLAIRTLLARGHITAVGRRIGVGKESDVFEVRSEEGEVLALKLHRLGRTSFRAVKSKRDYLRDRSSASFSWLYLSRLAALKEYAFMAALGQRGLPVPRAVDHNRHAVLMSLVDAYPLTQVRELCNPGAVYQKLMDFMERLARLGLIHCDFNEFNVMVNDADKVTIIDFPQMVSVAHPNGAELFARDVAGVGRFFRKKLGYMPEHDAALPRVAPNFEEILASIDASKKGLDTELAASGFRQHHQKALESWQLEAAAAAEQAAQGPEGAADDDSDADSDAGSDAGSGLSEAELASESDEDERQPAGSGSDASTDTRSAPDADADAAQQPEEAPGRSQDPLDAVEREAGGQPPVALAAASGGQPAGQPSQWAALTVQRNGGDGAAASSSDSQQLQPESDSDADTEGSTGWARSAAPPSTTATGRSRRRRQEVGPQDVQRLVASKRQSAARRNVMASASRNAQKRTSQKRRSELNSSMAMG